jgi:hypothetical protein
VSDQTPQAQAGWYPVAPGSSQLRWWDGTQWTEHTHDPAAAYTTQQQQSLVAPEGTRPNTVWMWILAISPLLALASPILWSAGDYFRHLMVAAEGSSYDPMAVYASPAYLISVALSFALYAIAVVLSLADYLVLRKRGVPRPFHWAWSFLSSIVYVIGRTVVVRRRTGRGLAPLWVFIGATVATWIISTALVASALEQILPTITNYPAGG